jgi:hypothetical protein
LIRFVTSKAKSNYAQGTPALVWNGDHAGKVSLTKGDRFLLVELAWKFGLLPCQWMRRCRQHGGNPDELLSRRFCWVNSKDWETQSAFAPRWPETLLF